MSLESFAAMGGAGRGNWVGQDEGTLLALPGWQMRVKVSASDTAGSMTLLEARMAGNHAGPAEHIHVGHDESFFVLSGQLRFRVGDGYRTATSGETVFASRGLAHGFSNPTDQEARYLVALTPSGYEFYFERLATLVRKHGAMPSKDELARLMAEHGTFLATSVG
jgi:mannose-6-phosphate isomerase-like protein (cupin superfamily)